VYGSIGFNKGYHEFQITILKRPCCGYIGIAKDIQEPEKRGDYNTFYDSSTCVGMNNFRYGIYFFYKIFLVGSFSFCMFIYYIKVYLSLSPQNNTNEIMIITTHTLQVGIETWVTK
jgi:hypothetical protein